MKWRKLLSLHSIPLLQVTLSHRIKTFNASENFFCDTGFQFSEDD